MEKNRNLFSSTHLPKHSLPRLLLQEDAMGRDSGEEGLGGTLADRSTVIYTKV